MLIFAESLTLADPGYLAGDLMILGSAVLLGLRQTVMKRMVRGFHPYKVLFWQSLLSLPMFAAASVWLERGAAWDFTPEVVVAVLYQGVVVAGALFHLLGVPAAPAQRQPARGVRVHDSGGRGGAERAAGGRGAVLDAAGEHGPGGGRDRGRGAGPRA